MIKDYALGNPYNMKGVLGRIIGPSDKSSMGYIDGVETPSIVLLMTPHGTIFETGIAHLDEMTEEDLTKLDEYEKMAIKDSGIMYGHKLNELIK